MFSWLWSSAEQPANWGFLGALDESQEKALAELRTYFAEYLGAAPSDSPLKTDPLMSFSSNEQRDSFLLRFLRAREFNVGKAQTMLDVCLKWRCEEGMLKYHNPESIRSIMSAPGSQPYFVDSLLKDKEGRSYLVGRSSLISDGNLVPSEHLTAVKLVLEHGFVYKSEFPICTCSYLLDLRGSRDAEESKAILEKVGVGGKSEADVRERGGGLETLREGLRLAAEYYPECLHKVYILGSSTMFYLLWKMISVWLSKRTRDKVVFLSSQNWQTELSEVFEKDQLFQDFGGEGPAMDGFGFIERAVKSYQENPQKYKKM